MHQLRQFLRWMAPHISVDGKLDAAADPQDQHRDKDEEEEEEDSASVAAPVVDQTGKHNKMESEAAPFRVADYIVRIKWQKRGYPHAHILMWIKKPVQADMDKCPKSDNIDWSDEESCRAFVPRTAEELSDKFICTKSPGRWRESQTKDIETRETNAKLAEMLVHSCNSYCGRYTLGACRFGFPRKAVPRTRRRTAQELMEDRWKSSLAARRHEKDGNMGQYNITILRRWRASMDLQVICELTTASRYILGYAFKSEEDFAAARRMQAIIEKLAASAGKESLNAQQVYKAAHAALQGRTTSSFEACHLLLGFPVIEFSRDNVWIQVGPPETWTVWVPQKDERHALAQPDAYYEAKQDQEWTMPVAQRWYQHLQEAFAEQETDVPVEGSRHVQRCWKDVTFFDFCAGFRFVGKQFPEARNRPAIVGHRSFSPDLEPEAFYYSKLLLHLSWKRPGDWLQPEDRQSHAAAFQRTVRDRKNFPTFLQSVCMPELDGTVEAARKLQEVQATMYMKSKLAPAHLRDGWSHSRVDECNYQDALEIMEALKERHGANIDFLAPDTVPTGPASSAFAPVEGGEEAFNLLTTEEPTPATTRQRQAMEYILREVMDRPHTKNGHSTQRLRMLLHGPGGCGKSVVVRAAAHMLRQSGHGVIIAAPTGVAACNINGVTLHQCLFLPVVNRSYGKACDAPLPSGPNLAMLQEFWTHVSVLIVDEISFISSFMLDRMDAHLRLARNIHHIPFGGLHVVFCGDLYQLPPPGGQPSFCSPLWNFFELCELESNQRAAKDPEWAALLARVRLGTWTQADEAMLKDLVIRKRCRRQPAPGAVHLYATRAAVAEDNQHYLEKHVASSGAQLYQCPAVDINVKTGAPLSPDVVWAEPENTGGLEALFRVAVGLRVMLRSNIDIPDKLVSGACGTVVHIEAHSSGEVEDIWIKFEGQAGSRWCAEHETDAVRIRRRTATFQDMTDSRAERKQFPLVLAKAITIHKSQAATAHQGAHCKLDSTVTQEGQAYVALSRCPTREHCTLQNFNPKCLRFNIYAEWALTRLREQQADKFGSELWQRLMKPPHDKAFYTRRLAKLPQPQLHSADNQNGRPPWHCPQCGEAVANTKAAIRAHKRVCKATAAAKCRPKAKSCPKAKTKARAKCKPAATPRRTAATVVPSAAGLATNAEGKRLAKGSPGMPPPAKAQRKADGGPAQEDIAASQSAEAQTAPRHDQDMPALDKTSPPDASAPWLTAADYCIVV